MSESDNRGDDTPVLALMKALGIPLTREKYLEMAYMCNPPQELCPEEEAELPPQFRLKVNEEYE